MKMKRLTGLKKFLVVSLALMLGGCSFAYQTCPHADANHDRVCDLCGIELTILNNKCLNCGGVLTNGECATCNQEPAEEEKKCDTCGGALTDGECAVCDKAPVEQEEKCDTCGRTLTDGKCAVCDNKPAEEEKKCATCGGTLTNGKCATCDNKPVENKCATCGGTLTNGKCATCDNKPAENKCATCGGTLTNGKCATCDKEEEPKPISLNGKKILFTGNSLTYYGQTVLGSAGTANKVTKKQNDKGFFYQFCKENGATVNVANWTFSGHVFSEVFGGQCASCTESQGTAINHLDYLDDRSYDYVVMQSGPTEGTNDTTFVSDVENIMNIFKAGNANTKFVLLVPYTAYGKIGPGTPSVAKTTLNNLKTLANKGVIISDWGGLVTDILDKKVTVPGSTLTYSKNTFVVAQKASDGFHPNVLSGYITTVMTYCAITGDKAAGKAYEFCNDPSLRSSSSTSVYYNFDSFITKYYTVGTTNFDQVFASKTDMQGIQGLIDNHLSAKAYMNYKY